MANIKHNVPLHLARCRIAIQCIYIYIYGFRGVQAVLELRIAYNIFSNYMIYHWENVELFGNRCLLVYSMLIDLSILC